MAPDESVCRAHPVPRHHHPRRQRRRPAATTASLALVEGDGTRTHGERLPGRARARARRGRPAARRRSICSPWPRGRAPSPGCASASPRCRGWRWSPDRPVVGVSALDALALTAFEQLGRPRARIGCWMDAARGEVFAALYDVEERRPRRPDADRPDAARSGPAGDHLVGLAGARRGAHRHGGRRGRSLRRSAHRRGAGAAACPCWHRRSRAWGAAWREEPGPTCRTICSRSTSGARTSNAPEPPSPSTP